MSVPSVLFQGDFKQNSWDFPEIETLPSNVGGVTVVGSEKLRFHMSCGKKKKKKKNINNRNNTVTNSIKNFKMAHFKKNLKITNK